MFVPLSSRAYGTVTAFRNVFDGAYAAATGPVVVSVAVPDCRVSEPTLLDMFTIRGEAERAAGSTGALSDRVGRKPVYLVGAVGVGLRMFPFFALIDTRGFGNCCWPSRSGCSSTGRCTPRRRRSSPSCPPPGCGTRAPRSARSSRPSRPAPPHRFATALLADFGSSMPIALYVIAAALLTVLALVCTKETRHRGLADVEPGSATGTEAAREAVADPARGV